MSSEKPNLKVDFQSNGDIRSLYDLISKYQYTDEEASEVINIYEPYTNNSIPEVEHIEFLLGYFPNSKISESTLSAIQYSFPNRLPVILKLKK